jgi:hypothetical protein
VGLLAVYRYVDMLLHLISSDNSFGSSAAVLEFSHGQGLIGIISLACLPQVDQVEASRTISNCFVVFRFLVNVAPLACGCLAPRDLPLSKSPALLLQLCGQRLSWSGLHDAGERDECVQVLFDV